MSCPRGCCASYREHLTSVVISTGPTPQAAKESQLSRDLDAYKRLKESGVQPKAIDGCAALERGAETRHEVEHAALLSNKAERHKVTRAFESVGGPDAA